MNSIRIKLPLTYAGIALLTALALGAALLLPLRGFYLERERSYLQQNAFAIAKAVGPLLVEKDIPPADLNEHIRMISVLSQVRVVVLDVTQQPLADSGLPQSGDVMTIRSEEIPFPAVRSSVVAGSMPSSGLVVRFEPRKEVIKVANQQMVVVNPPADQFKFIYTKNAIPFEKPIQVAGSPALISVVPVANTMFGIALNADSEMGLMRSDQVIVQPVTLDQQVVGWVRLSDGPSYGRAIVSDVAGAWLFASLVAVLVSGTAGWWVSRRMTAPLLDLSAVTNRMAAGDLSARADLRQTDEFGSLGRSYNEMANRVERTVQALRRFAADAAHELHTPLTALRTDLELASAQPGKVEYLERAAEQLARMEHLTRDLLDLSRIESGAPEMVNERLDLASLLYQVCEPFASQAEQADIAFDLSLPGEPVQVLGQPVQLQRALCNLVDNALKFTPQGGQVNVELRVEGERAVLWVEDSGIGISPEDLPYLFERFHRGRNASGYPGSGLGLSIVRAIAQRHGGQVNVESQQGRTCFTLILPCSIDQE